MARDMGSDAIWVHKLIYSSSPNAMSEDSKQASFTAGLGSKPSKSHVDSNPNAVRELKTSAKITVIEKNIKYCCPPYKHDFFATLGVDFAVSFSAG